MSVLDLARRLFFTSALLLLGGVAISVITRDEWLTIARAVSLVAAVVAALAVLLLLAVGLRRIGATRAAGMTADGDTSHEQGQVGLHEPQRDRDVDIGPVKSCPTESEMR